MIGAHNKFTQPHTQYLGKRRGYSAYYPINFSKFMVKIENYYYINFINKNGRSSSKITR